MTRMLADSSSFHEVGGLVAGSRRGSNRAISSERPAWRLTPMMPHEAQELCWQTAVTTRFSTARRSLLLLMSRAISATLAKRRTSVIGATDCNRTLKPSGVTDTPGSAAQATYADS